MRTTIDIDADVLDLAKDLAAGCKISLGKAVSDLARRGAKTPLVKRNGFHVFIAENDAPRFGPDDVHAAVDAEDAEYSRFFQEAKG